MIDGIFVKGGSVVLVDGDEHHRWWMSPEQADRHADKIKQAAQQARNGIIPELEDD